VAEPWAVIGYRQLGASRRARVLRRGWCPFFGRDTANFTAFSISGWQQQARHQRFERALFDGEFERVVSERSRSVVRYRFSLDLWRSVTFSSIPGRAW